MPGGTEFILAEVEQRSASDLERTVGDLEKEIDLKVAGVSVLSLARFLDSLVRPLGRVIEGRLSRFGGEVSLAVIPRARTEENARALVAEVERWVGCGRRR